MGRSVFGWDLPPGVTTRDIDRAAGVEDISPLQEDILAALEEGGSPSEINDKIIEKVAELERGYSQLQDAIESACIANRTITFGPRKITVKHENGQEISREFQDTKQAAFAFDALIDDLYYAPEPEDV